MLKELWEERDVAIKHAEGMKLKAKATKLRLEHIIRTAEYEWERLEAEGDLACMNAEADQAKACYEEALRERDFLEKVIDYIQPYRKYGHLPDHEAFQEIQREEWGLELIRQAENSLLTTGSINPGQFDAMRAHPDFKEIIAPKIQDLYTRLEAGELSLGNIDSVLLPCIEEVKTLLLEEPKNDA